MHAKAQFQPYPAPVPTPGTPPPTPRSAAPIVLPDAATIMFDAAPVFAHTNGMLSVTLTAKRFLPDGQGGIVEQEVVVGFLRCGMHGVQSLQKALGGVALLARPAEGGAAN